MRGGKERGAKTWKGYYVGKINKFTSSFVVTMIPWQAAPPLDPARPSAPFDLENAICSWVKRYIR